MSPSESTEVEAAAQSEHGVLCARCEHLNQQGAARCTECGARLFVECSACGEFNQRVFTRCRKCHKRLHRGLFDRRGRRRHRHHLSWRSLKRRLSLSVLQVVLVLVALGLAFLVFFLLNASRLPSLR